MQSLRYKGKEGQLGLEKTRGYEALGVWGGAEGFLSCSGKKEDRMEKRKGKRRNWKRGWGGMLSPQF